MDNSPLVLVVDEDEHLEGAQQGQLNRFLQKSFLPFTVSNLPMAQIVNLSNLLDSFPHLKLYYSIRVETTI